MQFGFRFGGPAGLQQQADSLDIVLPNRVVAGGREVWAQHTAPGAAAGPFTLSRDGGRLWGAAFADIAGVGFREAAERLYRELFAATDGLTLCRIWNFLPRINGSDGDIENYRAFCQGRHLAFTGCFGADSERRMPAASAVGTGGDRLCVVFLAGPDPVRYVENPHQVPAYRYPRRYGPRAPSFARAAVAGNGADAVLYVSGTASIRGSESRHRDDVRAQLELALDNMDAVARAAGFERGLDAASPGRRQFRVYLRHAEDWPQVRDVLQHRLLRPDDALNAIQADICRSELLVEIEACVA